MNKILIFGIVALLIVVGALILFSFSNNSQEAEPTETGFLAVDGEMNSPSQNVLLTNKFSRIEK